MRGTPYLVRLSTGLSHPRFTGLGVDAAGDVVAVGAAVTDFQPGQPVFGMCRGAFAEFAIAKTTQLAPKPTAVTYQQAATIPIAGLTALQGLRDAARVARGQRVLVNGASGGVGTFAVQIAKVLGAHVTGVCSAKNVAAVLGLGADAVIDYTRDDFTADSARYDILLDCVGNHSAAACRRVLTRDGRHVMVGGPSSDWMLGAMVSALTAPLVSKVRRQKMIPILARARRSDLETVGDWVSHGALRPLIERRYALPQLPDAIAQIETGHTTGKLVIIVDDAE
jgi:NADPH:quinone reductase-like Zn-dependent oxidoreductase